MTIEQHSNASIEEANHYKNPAMTLAGTTEALTDSNHLRDVSRLASQSLWKRSCQAPREQYRGSRDHERLALAAFWRQDELLRADAQGP